MSTKKESFKIGFTGTRDGMTRPQKEAVKKLIAKATEFHHGDCLGSDTQAHDIAKGLGIKTVAWPPKNEKQRAFCLADVVMPADEFLTRDHKIVDATLLLVATPKSDQEERRSGTWATVRYARRQRKTIAIVHPDGKVVQEIATLKTG